jgi:hypothetical protein
MAMLCPTLLGLVPVSSSPPIPPPAWLMPALKNSVDPPPPWKRPLYSAKTSKVSE